jgi:hypothetical protein
VGLNPQPGTGYRLVGPFSPRGGVKGRADQTFSRPGQAGGMGYQVHIDAAENDNLHKIPFLQNDGLAIILIPTERRLD